VKPTFCVQDGTPLPMNATPKLKILVVTPRCKSPPPEFSILALPPSAGACILNAGLQFCSEGNARIENSGGGGLQRGATTGIFNFGVAFLGRGVPS